MAWMNLGTIEQHTRNDETIDLAIVGTPGMIVCARGTFHELVWSPTEGFQWPWGGSSLEASGGGYVAHIVPGQTVVSALTLFWSADAGVGPAAGATFLTQGDETALLPLSRRLVDGINTTVNIATSGEIAVDLAHIGAGLEQVVLEGDVFETLTAPIAAAPLLLSSFSALAPNGLVLTAGQGTQIDTPGLGLIAVNARNGYHANASATGSVALPYVGPRGVYHLTLTGNLTLTAFPSAADGAAFGDTIDLVLQQNGTGGYTSAFPTGADTGCVVGTSDSGNTAGTRKSIHFCRAGDRWVAVPRSISHAWA